MTSLSKTEWTRSRKVSGCDVHLVWHSPPKLGGVPSRSEGGAVCSKIARSAHLINGREALLINRCASRGHPRLTKAGTGRHQPRHPFLLWTALVYDRALYLESTK